MLLQNHRVPQDGTWLCLPAKGKYQQIWNVLFLCGWWYVILLGENNHKPHLDHHDAHEEHPGDHDGHTQYLLDHKVHVNDRNIFENRRPSGGCKLTFLRTEGSGKCFDAHKEHFDESNGQKRWQGVETGRWLSFWQAKKECHKENLKS